MIRKPRNRNRKVEDYKINEFLKFLSLQNKNIQEE